MRWFVLCLALLLPATASADVGQAQRNYQRIWKQDRRYFGEQGQPAPTLGFSKKGEGYTTTGSTDRTDVLTLGMPRAIHIGPAARRQLKRFDPKSGKDPTGIRFAIEHEFGRYFGPDSQLDSTGNGGAGLANAVANRLAHARNTGSNPKPYLRKKLPYFGQDPTTITWPAS